MSPFFQNLAGPNNQSVQVLFVILAIWSIPWKALALWHSSKNEEKVWFLVLLVVNTVGILEIIYLFFISKHKLTREKFNSYVKFK